MCEDPNVWYTEEGEKIVDDTSNLAQFSNPETLEMQTGSYAEEIVLIDLSTGVIED